MAFVFARPLDAWLAGFAWLAGEQSILRLLALFGVVFGIHILVSLPLSFYSGYVVEHRFKLSNQSLGRWVEELAQAQRVRPRCSAECSTSGCIG